MTESDARPRRVPIEHTCGGGQRWKCACTNARRTELRKRDPEQVRASNLWRLYRIRPDEYDAMRAAQDYRCVICGRHEDEIPVQPGGRPRKDGSSPTPPAKLVVDHCHARGSLRSLLCQPCNVMLGQAADDPARLRAGAAYLEQHA